MGINVNGLRFLLYARSRGVDFAKTATIGRQGLHMSFDQFCNVLLSEFNHDADSNTLEAIYDYKYADELFRYLGADEVCSFDCSDYQGSTHIHDFNRAIPEEYYGRHTVVIDGGTLEHVFDFPTAIKNCMEMVALGGHYIGMSPANNYMGHGFYQFSPELYFRIFCEKNGFRTEHMILHEGRDTRTWLTVADPANIRQPVTLTNCRQTLLSVLATRMEYCSIFSIAPQQSQYTSIWKGLDAGVNVNIVQQGVYSILKRFIPKSVKELIRAVRGASHRRAFFEPFNPVKDKNTTNKAL